jgi:capsid protein
VTDNPTLLDRLIGYVSPRWAAERAYFRAAGFATSYRGSASTRLDNSWSSLVPQGVRTRERIQREDFRQMRARARQLERDNVLAAAMLDRATENVVGTGLRARPMSSSPEFNEAAARNGSDGPAGRPPTSATCTRGATCSGYCTGPSCGTATPACS